MPTILNNILINQIITPIDDQIANLIEKERQAKLKLVKILNVPNDSTLIKGEDTQVKNYFNNTVRGNNMRCDYILIANNTIFYIELKTNSEASTILANDCIKKFKATKCIIDYFDSILLEFNNRSFFNEKEKRFVLFHLSPSINKTTTSLKPKEEYPAIVNNIPENFKFFFVRNEEMIDISKMS